MRCNFPGCRAPFNDIAGPAVNMGELMDRNPGWRWLCDSYKTLFLCPKHAEEAIELTQALRAYVGDDALSPFLIRWCDRPEMR